MSHLTEDQIDELLMGSLEADEATRLREHAATCEACAAQLAEIEAPIASFNAVTLSWSERRSATMPVRPAVKHTRWGMGFAWGSVAAVALLAAIIPVLRHEQNIRVQQAYNAVKMQGVGNAAAPGTPMAAPVNSTNAQDGNTGTDVRENAQEIASDNHMLALVDEELNAPIAAPAVATPGRGRTRANAQGTVQD